MCLSIGRLQVASPYGDHLKIVRDVFASVTDMRQDASAETLCEVAGRAVGAVQVLEPEDSLDDLRYGLLHERDAEARAEAQRAPCRW